MFARGSGVAVGEFRTSLGQNWWKRRGVASGEDRSLGEFDCKMNFSGGS